MIPTRAFLRRPTRSLAFLFLVPALLAPAGRAQTSGEKLRPETRQPGFDSIKADDCKAWLTVLASDEFGGRATGTEGFEKAARFVAERFKEFGLKPIGDEGTYFQKVPFERTVADAAVSWIALRGKDGAELLKIPLGQGLGGRVNEKSESRYPLVIVRADAPTRFEPGQFKDKAVLLVGKVEPRAGGRLGSPVATAQPVVTVVCDDAEAAIPPERNARATYTGGARRGGAGMTFRSPNRLAITAALAEKILHHTGTPAALEKEGWAPADGFELETHIAVKTEPAFACNVVGFLEGSDEKLKAETVGVGSHLDHIGTNPDGRVNNGADDDGSGTTGVLAVARAFTRNPARPKRSLVFMCFCGEEMGLIGSRWYVEHPILPNGQMVAEIQMDMIGRNEEGPNDRPEDNLNSLHLVGSKRLSSQLHDICLTMNDRHTGFDFEWDQEDVYSRSDHVNFANKGIPIAFLFTGFHPQYHRHDDEVGLINFPKLARVAQLAYAIAFEVADRAERIEVDVDPNADDPAPAPPARRTGAPGAGAQGAGGQNAGSGQGAGSRPASRRGNG